MEIDRVTIIIAVTGFIGLLNGIQRFLVPIAMIHYKWSLSDYGWVFTFQAVSMALPMLLGGISTDIKGRKQTITGGFVLLVIGTILFMYSMDGSNLWLIIISQVISTISFGVSRLGLSIILADETQPGFDRTNALGKQATSRNAAAFLGPVLIGIHLENEVFDFGIGIIHSAFLILVILSVIGIMFSFILPTTSMEIIERNKQAKISDFTTKQKKMQAAFGIEEMIIGFTSGMIVPFIDYYILAEFDPPKDVWGLVYGISNSSIAIGSLLVGRYAERFGKGNTVLGLYIIAPFLALGIALSSTFSLISVFYILRTTSANMAHPAWESWFFSHTPDTVRGRTMSVIQLSRRLARGAGTATGTVLFATMGTLLFPVGCLFYPIAMVIPRGVEKMIEKE